MKAINVLWALALAIFATACANEDTANKDNNKGPTVEQGTTFVGGTTLKPKATRTSLNMTYPGGTQVDYFWEQGDKIWTADGTNGVAQIAGKSATAHFIMPKVYTSATVQLYYPGKGATVYNQVTIATNQSQSEPNSTSKLGEYGDCGTATAHQQTDKSYQFNLDHYASYLCLMPYNLIGLTSAYVKQVKITSDNNIAGTYTLTPTGLTGSGTDKSITLTTTSTAHPDGFPINNSAVNQAANAIYAVIAPGTHSLTIEYTLYDKGTQVTGTLTKKLPPNLAFAHNQVYPIEVDINPKNYSSNGYYMWDAQQHYWYGHESDQTKLDDDPAPPAGTWPQNKAAAPDRWYNDVPAYHDGNPVPLATKAPTDNCPHVNELCWYAKYGNIHWDNKTLWAVMGHLYIGGVWIKKLSVIAAERGENSNNYKNAAPNGTNWAALTDDRGLDIGFVSDNRFNPIEGISDIANLNDYFYLPALGDYEYGKFETCGYTSTFWANTPTPSTWPTDRAYYLYFWGGRGSMPSGFVMSNSRYLGGRAWKADDSDNQYRPNGM